MRSTQESLKGDISMIDTTTHTTSHEAHIREILADDAGATTAEYAVTIVAACAFAALLFAVLTSGEMQGMLTSIIQGALRSAS